MHAGSIDDDTRVAEQSSVNPERGARELRHERRGQDTRYKRGRHWKRSLPMSCCLALNGLNGRSCARSLSKRAMMSRARAEADDVIHRNSKQPTK
jgi:hypothetical protein